jgi:UDP:flavonoid glycosyltransferase YjiC (YdhE family)
VQQRNAAACERTGVARVLPEAELSVESVRASVRAILDIGSYKQAARRVAREIEAMPAPDKAVASLARLVGTTGP